MDDNLEIVNPEPEMYASIRGVASFTAQVLFDLADSLGLDEDEAIKLAITGGLLGAKRWQELLDAARENSQYSTAAYVLYDGDDGLDDDEEGEN